MLLYAEPKKSFPMTQGNIPNQRDITLSRPMNSLSAEYPHPWYENLPPIEYELNSVELNIQGQLWDRREELSRMLSNFLYEPSRKS